MSVANKFIFLIYSYCMTYTLDKFYSIVNIITIELIFDFHHLSLFQLY